MEGVCVLFIEVLESTRYGEEKAWRICWLSEDGRHEALGLPFGRKIDAEMALRELDRRGFTVSDLRTMTEDEWELTDIDKACIESLQW